MAERTKAGDFTVYLEGHEVHQGNVLLRPFHKKLQRLELVLNKLERAYLSAATRRTDFEIVNAAKNNPTSLTLRIVPHVINYNPHPAFEWGVMQMAAVGRGENPDDRVTADIAEDLVELSTRDSEADYRAFWINGYTDAIRFDDQYRERAERLAREKKRKEQTGTPWHVGASAGSVVGELKMASDLDGERRIVLVPPAGPQEISCTFPESMKETISVYLFKMVRVSGVLHYDQRSPFAYQVDVAESGINLLEPSDVPGGLAELRGVFSDTKRETPDWDSVLNGR